METPNAFFREGSTAEEMLEEKKEVPNIFQTTLEEYLELIKQVKNDSTEYEQGNENKAYKDISQKVLNEALNIRNNELIRHGIALDAGYLPVGEIGFTQKDLLLKYGSLFTFESHTIRNNKREVIGHQYLVIKKELSPVEQSLKNEILHFYSQLQENHMFLVSVELNKLMEEKVKNGEMVFLGEQTIDDYLDLIEKGLPPENVESVPCYDSHAKQETLTQRIYARIK